MMAAWVIALPAVTGAQPAPLARTLEERGAIWSQRTAEQVGLVKLRQELQDFLLAGRPFGIARLFLLSVDQNLSEKVPNTWRGLP